VPVLILVVIAAARRGPRLGKGTAFGSARFCTDAEADAAGMYRPGGFFLGRAAGAGRLRATARLFNLPPGRSAEAVRGWLAAFFPRKA
jgi:hypothetical protein